MPDITAALPTFFITLREGFEAALVVGIVLSCIQKAGALPLRRWVAAGVAVGVAASVAVGWVLHALLVAIDASERATILKPAIEALFAVIAIAALSWMLIWMTQQAKSLKGEIEGAVRASLAGGSAAGVFSLVAIAVLREGFETVIFVTAQFSQGWQPVAGAVAGLAGATLLGVALFAWGVRIDIRRFFQVMGAILVVVVAGFVVSALKNLNLAIELAAQVYPQWSSLCNPDASSCILGAQVWDLKAVLPDREFPGVLFKLLLGYRDRIYALQAVGYVLFLGAIGGLYFQSLNAGTRADG
ncbi:MAG: FTR1 family protein [Geitlerinemataceae cyanobacterium]